MRTEIIERDIYQFNELSESAKESAREWYREGALDYDWWDSVYECLEVICGRIGLEVDMKRTYFQGFYCQGSGSAIDVSGNAFDMFRNMENPTDELKAFLDNQYFSYDSLPVLPNRIRKLLEAGHATVTVSGNDFHGYGIGQTTDGEIDAYSGNSYHDRIEAALEPLQAWAEELIQDVNNWFYKTLMAEYEYLMSDEQVDEAIEVNEYEFTEDGEPN